MGPTLYVKSRTVEVAQRRQQLHPEDTPVRVVIESTVRSLKQGFPGSKLPVRGLIRARMILYPAGLMVNLRRVHHYLTTRAEEAATELASSLSVLERAVYRCSKAIHRYSSVFLLAVKSRPLAVSPG